ncbi:unnamed protein product [Linum trigynum]|uniref:RNase H type-1 domain-containing protein n=1 Tax=Linum trigynum TaxID=586398 RepID=A0AAV2D4Y4_9ROSI
MVERDLTKWEESRNHTNNSANGHFTSLQTQPRGSRSDPSPPPGPFQKIVHCDGSFVSESQLAAYGIAIANSHGQVFDGKAETFYCSVPIQAEALALLNAVRMAALDPVRTSIRCDCQILTLALKQHPSLWP